MGQAPLGAHPLHQRPHLGRGEGLGLPVQGGQASESRRRLPILQPPQPMPIHQLPEQGEATTIGLVAAFHRRLAPASNAHHGRLPFPPHTFQGFSIRAPVL
jgi:hypothetical protein